MPPLQDIITKDSTDRSVTVLVIDSTTGLPETGVAYNTTGIDLWYRREGGAKVSITEATLATVDAAHADGGFIHISDGVCRLDLPDAAFATGANYVDFGGTVTDMIVVGGRVRLVDLDLESEVVNLGTNAPANWINAAAIASNAFTTAKFADGVFTAAKFASGAFDAVWSVTTRTLSAFGFGVTVATNNDKTGYSLVSTGLDAITAWAVAITGNITGNLSGSVGSVTAAVETDSASRTASKATAGEIRDAVGLGSANLDTQLGDIGTDADVSAGILATLTEDVSGLRFTEKALEEAPTGSGGGGDDAATIYSYFADGTRPNIFKADVSGLVETGDLPANFGALGINASGHVSRVTLVDTTTTNTDMRGTDSAYTGTPPTEAEIYDYFADGSRPEVFKADVSGLSTYDGSDTSGTTTLLSRLSSARAGYLDKLNVSGVLAHTNNASSFMADVSAIPNTTAFEARTLPTADYATLSGQGAIASAITGLNDFDPSSESVTVSTASANAIADATIGRDVANVEDTSPVYSLATVILASQNSSISGTTLTIRKTGGSTYATRQVSVDSDADPITGVGSP